MAGKSVNSNDVMAVITWVKVDRVAPNKLEVTNLDNEEEFQVIGDTLIDGMHSADRYNAVTQVPLTKMADVLSKSYNTPFTVLFEKKDGELRTLRGRLLDSEPLLGRVKVEDLDIPKGEPRMRLVDNRTLKELIVGGVKYTLK